MRNQGAPRHLVAPRTLLFLEREERTLFIEGAARKWWAGRLNGIGGSVEAGEDIFSAARREAEEETGLCPLHLELAAIIHTVSNPAVLLFVFLGSLPPGALRPCDEGDFCWLPRAALSDPALAFMPDLPYLLPRLWAWRSGSPPLSLLFDLTDGFRPSEGLP